MLRDHEKVCQHPDVLELLEIFVDVLTPVVGVAAAGALAGKLWKLDYRPLSTIAYYVLAPAFVFRLLAEPGALDGPIAAMAVASASTVFVVFGSTWLFLRRTDRRRRALDSAAAAFGNVGNLGFPVVLFAFGSGALAEATVHFLAVLVTSFFFGVAAAAGARAGNVLGAAWRVVTTPALLVVIPAVFANTNSVDLPAALERFIGLLADAMIPVMLLTLGIQLVSARLTAGVGRIGVITAAKLALSPAVFFVVGSLLGLTGEAFDTGLILAATPTAVLVGLLSLEYDLESEVASAAILVTSLLGTISLSAILSVV